MAHEVQAVSVLSPLAGALGWRRGYESSSLGRKLQCSEAESSSLLAPPELVAEGGSVGHMLRVGPAELLALGPPAGRRAPAWPGSSQPHGPPRAELPPHGPRWVEGARGSRTWAV